MLRWRSSRQSRLRDVDGHALVCDSARFSVATRTALSRLFVLLSLLTLCCGCHRGLVYAPGQVPPDCLATHVHTAQRLNLTGFARAGTNSQQIIPGDLLQVSVATGLESEAQASWRAVRVSDGGTVELPLIGTVAVAGLEQEGAERRIREESVRRGIYRAPQVSVSLLQRRMNRITVVGSVRAPGVKELPASECDLFAALVAAGGLAEDASTLVEIRHASGPAATVQPAAYQAPPSSSLPRELRDRVDLAALSEHGSSAALADGTVVMVMPQPARTVQVMGLVTTPSQIKMPADRDMRLLDAIAQAGGVTLQVANKVHIIRQVPGREQPVVIATSIREAKANAGANVVLASGDVISVEETLTTFTVDTLRNFIRFGFTSAIPGL